MRHQHVTKQLNKYFDERQSAAPQVRTKDRMKHLIAGTLDSSNICPMGGVTTYPYKQSEMLYREDFQGIIASRITHPFLTTAVHGGSLPFNVLSGSNYDEGIVAGGNHPRWITESASQFYAMSPDKKSGAGARTEQEIH